MLTKLCTVSVQLFSMASYHSSLSLPSMLHLYNFLLHVESILPGLENIKPIPLLELLCEAFGKHVFQGSRPTKNFSARFAVSTRKEISTFASDAHRRLKTMVPTPKQLERLALPPIMSTLHAVVADHYKLHGQAYSWIEKTVQPVVTTAANTEISTATVTAVKNGGGKRLLQSLSPAQLLDKISEALWVDFNGPVPIGRVDMLKIRELSYRVRSSVYSKVRADFGSRRFREGPDFDLTQSILEIEKYAYRPEIQKKIINGTRDVFVSIFEGLTMERFFAKMPYSRTKGWKDKFQTSNSTGTTLKTEKEAR